MPAESPVLLGSTYETQVIQSSVQQLCMLPHYRILTKDKLDPLHTQEQHVYSSAHPLYDFMAAFINLTGRNAIKSLRHGHLSSCMNIVPSNLDQKKEYNNPQRSRTQVKGAALAPREGLSTLQRRLFSLRRAYQKPCYFSDIPQHGGIKCMESISDFDSGVSLQEETTK